ncbi:hypothetical protein Tco_1508177 [Tanacetum coccineum]
MCKAYGGDPSVDLLRAFLNLGPTEMDFISFMVKGIDDEFHFILEGDNIGDSDDAPSKKDEVTLIDRTTAEKTQNLKVSASSRAARKRKQTAESSEKEPRLKVRKVPPQASKFSGDAFDPLDVDSDPDIHEFPSAKELKDSADCHFVVAHVTPPSWKWHLKEIILEKLYDIHDRAYMRQAMLDNMLNSKTRKLISTLSKAKDSCDAIREREVERDKAYAELERKCNEAQQDSDNNPLVLEMRSKIETLQGERLKSSETQLLQEIDGLRQDRAAVVAKVVPHVATKLVRSDEVRSSRIFKIFHLLKNSSFAFKSFCFILLFTLSHQIKNPNNLPLFDDDKTNKVVYELQHKAKASPEVEM